MKVLLAPFVFLFVSFTAAKRSQETKPILINNAFTIVIEDKYTESEDLFKMIKRANKNAVYMAVIETRKAKVPFLVSKYLYKEPLSIDEAFAIAKNHNAEGPSYKLLSTQTYKLGEKTFRCKISELSFESGGKVDNIMFYLMKEDKGTAAYEIKMSSTPEEMEANKKRLEQIVQSVTFL